MKAIRATSVVFFDLGATLVDPTFGPDGGFAGFVALPDAQATLQRLKAAKLRMGVISNTGEIAPQAVRDGLAEANLLPFFVEDLILLSGELGTDKSSTKIFRIGAAKAKAEPSACIFVGDDPNERRTARLAGLQTRRTPKQLVAPPLARAPEHVSLAALTDCVDDARDAGLDSTSGPPEPDDYDALLDRLEDAKLSLPAIYRQRFAEPFMATLRTIGPQGFNRVLARDPGRQGMAGLMFDIAQAVLQNGEDFEKTATDAFQEMVSDLYDGFLSAEDRAGIKAPDNTIFAPLVKWGNPDSGPYTWPIDATSSFGVSAAVVNLPPANAHHGLFAWAALGHETAGHDIIHADDGLEAEFSQAVFEALRAAQIGAGLADYWSQRIDETASDVMGILNMGPAAAIGLVIYFRGLNMAASGIGKLRNAGPAQDPHPADILRGFLAAATVRLLEFDEASEWADAIERETERDVTQISVGAVPITVERAKRSCEIVANTLVTGRMAALNHHALIDIQNWRNQDEEIVRELSNSLVTNAPIQTDHETGIYAAHVVAGATLSALAGTASVENVFRRMIGVLKKMHDSNASWGPLFIVHPGSISRDAVYVRHTSPLAPRLVPVARSEPGRAALLKVAAR